MIAIIFDVNLSFCCFHKDFTIRDVGAPANMILQSMKYLGHLCCFSLLIAFTTLSLAQEVEDDLPLTPLTKSTYQCVDWQGIRRERAAPCAETGESEFRGYDNINEAKHDIKKLVHTKGKPKIPAQANHEPSSNNPPQPTVDDEELSPEEKRRRRHAWIKFIAVACVFGTIAKLKKASFIRWAIVGVFVYGTLVLGNFVTL